MRLDPHRDGITFDHARDGQRLAAQHQRIWALMIDGCWRSLQSISSATGDGEASISARLRDFRKPRFGLHGVERRYVRNGLHEYRLVINRRDLWS